MKYCHDCKAYAWEGLDNCPLCGSHLEEVEEKFELYDKQNAVVSRPKVTYRRESAFLKKKSFVLILSIIAVCILINVIITPWSLWSAYVACGGLAASFGVLSAIYNKRRLYSILSVSALVAPLSVAAVDAIQSLDRLGNFSGMSFSLPYAVPGILIGITIALDVLAMIKKRKYRYYTVALLPTTLLSLVPQILQWTIKPSTPGFLTFACFAFAIANLLIMTIIYWTKMKGEWRRKMHL